MHVAEASPDKGSSCALWALPRHFSSLMVCRRPPLALLRSCRAAVRGRTTLRFLVLLCFFIETMVPDVSDVGAAACFEVVPISGKGHGCRALRSIARGERLCAESPLFTQGPGQPPLQQAVDRLSTEDRRKFFALTQNSIRFGSIPTARGIFSTNCLLYTSPSPRDS